MTRFLVYDVFTDTAFGGNQLAVVPDAKTLPEDALQGIAREFNFSETTFVYPADDPAHTARVRIFTPTMEVPFAGHPIVGTAIALRDLGHMGDMILELGVGPVPCRLHPRCATFTTSAPLKRLATPPSSLEGAAKFPAGLDFALYAYVRQDDQIDARMFAPLDNIPEDPATGSAAATLAAILTEAKGQALALNITQGAAMGRPSSITATTEIADVVKVTIGGNAVRTMEGWLVY